MVEVAELQGDSIAVLETCIEEQLWVKLQVQHVATQVLHILFYYNVDDLTCGRNTKN